MLILFETAAGFALFKLLDETKLEEPLESLSEHFKTIEQAKLIVELLDFENFDEIEDAADSVLTITEGQIPQQVEKLLAKQLPDCKEEVLLVGDRKLGQAIVEKFRINFLANKNVLDLIRCIRSQINGLLDISPESKNNLNEMALGLARSVSTKKIQRNPNVVDLMIKQAINLHGKLVRELEKYVARCRNVYGTHFPELANFVPDGQTYVRVVQMIGHRSDASGTDLSSLLSTQTERCVKEMAVISCGKEITPDEFPQIRMLTERILDMFNWAKELEDYLELRMKVVAPNLTTLVGSLIGGQLIAKAGSLLNLAKKPASTILLYGAHKALFTALRKRPNLTPKHGFIYNAPVVAKAHRENKGKICRLLSCKIAIAARIDSFSEDTTLEGVSDDVGSSCVAQIQERLARLNSDVETRISQGKPLIKKIKLKAVPPPSEVGAGNSKRKSSQSQGPKNSLNVRRFSAGAGNKRSYERRIRQHLKYQHQKSDSWAAQVGLDSRKRKAGEMSGGLSEGWDHFPNKRIRFCDAEENLANGDSN